MIDEVQMRAATSSAQNTLVVAPPGCGKTELLAMRANHLIPSLLPNERILALTFSNRARDNLSERMRTHLGSQRFRRYLRVRNFHGHATEIIKAHCRTIGLDPLFELPTKRLLDKAVRELSNDEDAIAAAKADLGEAKRQPRSDAEVAAVLEQTGSHLAIEIEAARVASGQLHYEDLLRHAQRALRVDEIAYLYQQHYGAVLVDEFQDLSPQQLDLALRSCLRSRTFVGDPLQGIYSWAGAEPLIIEKQLFSMCAPSFFRLTKSYRSSPAVLAMVNSAGVPLGAASLTSAMPDRWLGGGASSAVAFSRDSDEAQWIVARCADIVAADPIATIGVIARSGWRRKVIDRAFASRDDLEVHRWDLAVDQPETVDRLRKALREVPRSATFAHLRERALAALRPEDIDARSDLLEAIADIETEATGVQSIHAAVGRYLRLDEDNAVSAGVHLLNAHTGKGQQFDWVFVPGLEEGHLPDFHDSSAAGQLEERRVLLVMLSRARRAVAVTRASQFISKRGSPYTRPQCPWWHQLIESATMDRQSFENYARTEPQDSAR